ncbi:MAG: dTDP-glucose 4,6-dehydratase [Candidatus Magnetoglobus multicellularis str. Araruama]|uniref:UDP-glucuronate decarboxylase n=1 Tax=Candidatus Magnetoglobus multicellularis str. Araruama TaxID=890399 RepID=A0A1V1PCH5_9BACT|nr:MAG: dTDP-glucose 4,6-dehydratase [Candidatus Magnetoglobus multicellularis str. Araruama]
MKRILVTGGAGFIGSHLCEKFVNDGHDVICLDNLFCGSKKNIYHLLSYPNFEFIRHDIVNPISLEIDQIYNMACPASPVHYQHNPVKTVKTNVMGALNMLELANSVNATILQASTSEIYGDPEMHPQQESYWGNVNPIGLRSCYDEGKRVAETLIMDFHRQNQVDVKIVRIFNTYGPKVAINDGRVISNFIVQALSGQDITIYGDGQQTRSFCYVDDMLNGLIKMMHSPSDFTGPVNLGNPSETTVLTLAQMIVEMTESQSKIIFQHLPQDDPKKRKPDISLAKSALDWTPCVPLEEGLARTIDYFKNNYSIEQMVL